MEYKIIISDRAKQMIANHIQFLAKANKNAAKEKKTEIISVLRSLSQMPNRFPFFEEEYIPKNKYHKMFIKNWYLVLFQIKDSTVKVDYIIDCRQDYGWLIR